MPDIISNLTILNEELTGVEIECVGENLRFRPMEWIHQYDANVKAQCLSFDSFNNRLVCDNVDGVFQSNLSIRGETSGTECLANSVVLVLKVTV
jgi:hypothetical protein